ncbi:MAG: beta-propeller domain-containing protein [Bacilli bacterium]|jgi:uncharacterized secreted protein with C-terminal beta-propeller domain|nr:hypothetical protein [Acholeplasmataceae bacterium]
MKFKDWKRNLREQEFNIPDIYEKIKPYAYQKRVRSEPVLVRPLVKRKMLFAPLYILLLLFSFIIFSPTNKQRDSLLVGDQHVSYFTGIEEIETYLQENKGENPTYKSGLQVESQSIRNSGVAMPEFPMSGINEYLDEATTVEIRNDHLYLVTPSFFKAFDIENGKLELLHSQTLSAIPGGIAEMHVTDECIALVYADLHRGEEDIDTATNILVLDSNFQIIYEYSVAGNYLDSYLIGNKLFIFNQIPLMYRKEGAIPLPEISENAQRKNTGPQDIAYIQGFGAEAYTIITSIDLNRFFSEDTILLSYDKWEKFHFSENNLYLINSHTNTDDKLEFGIYTAVIRYDIRNGINYGNSIKFKGKFLNKSACDEYEGYFRIAVTDIDYKITKGLLQSKATVEAFGNKILVLKASEIEGAQIKIVNTIDINKNEHLKGAKFAENGASALSNTGKFYSINLSNPRLPKFETPLHDEDIELFYYQLNEDTAFSIQTDAEIKGYKISLLAPDAKAPNVWRELVAVKQGGFSYFPVLEAANNRKAFFVQKIDDNFYLGFAITNYNKLHGNFHLFEIDPENKTCKQVPIDFSETSYPTRMIANEETKLIYAISDSAIAVYNYNFEKVDVLKFN